MDGWLLFDLLAFILPLAFLTLFLSFSLLIKLWQIYQGCAGGRAADVNIVWRGSLSLSYRVSVSIPTRGCASKILLVGFVASFRHGWYLVRQDACGFEPESRKVLTALSTFLQTYFGRRRLESSFFSCLKKKVNVYL